MKRSVLFTLGLVLLVGAVAFAQGKPNFAGTWTLDPAKSEMPQMGGGGGRGGGMGGGPITITQSATELVMERTMGENTVKTVYKLDGSPSTNQSGRGGTSTAVSKWDGSRLVTAIKSESQRGTSESTEVRYLAPDGTMVVETTRQTPNGEMKTKMVYTKG